MNIVQASLYINFLLIAICPLIGSFIYNSNSRKMSSFDNKMVQKNCTIIGFNHGYYYNKQYCKYTIIYDIEYIDSIWQCNNDLQTEIIGNTYKCYKYRDQFLIWKKKGNEWYYIISVILFSSPFLFIIIMLLTIIYLNNKVSGSSIIDEPENIVEQNVPPYIQDSYML